jgi:hypothetical protein
MNWAKENRDKAFHLQGSGIAAAVVELNDDDDLDVIISSTPPPMVFVNSV